MPRKARIISSSSLTYHVMLRGINRQQVFLEPDDNELFVEVLKECKAICGFRLYAFCLMGNHIHLLIKTEEEGIGQVMKRVGVRFVQRINRKYGRSGCFRIGTRVKPCRMSATF